MSDKLGYMRTCDECRGVDLGDGIIHKKGCPNSRDELVKQLERSKVSDYDHNKIFRLTKLLKRSKSWLDVACLHVKGMNDLTSNIEELQKEIEKEIS